MAQRKRTGLITPGSLDRNQLSLYFLLKNPQREKIVFFCILRFCFCFVFLLEFPLAHGLVLAAAGCGNPLTRLVA